MCRWSLIAGRVPDRTDKQIKSYWYTTLKKKLGVKRLIRPKTHKFVSFPMKQLSGENRGRSVLKCVALSEEGEEEVQSAVFSGVQQNARHKICKSTGGTKITRKEMMVRCDRIATCKIEIEDSWSGTRGVDKR